jgi:hypothetical protein
MSRRSHMMKSIFELMRRLFFNIRHRIINTRTQKLFNCSFDFDLLKKR